MDQFTRSDVESAVAAGVLDERQAAALLAHGQARQGYRDRMAADDEPFEFFRGFGEIFIAVGLVMLFAALHALVPSALAPTVGLIGIVALAVYFTRKRRMSLPSILLATAFAIEMGYVLIAGLEAFGAAPWDSFWDYGEHGFVAAGLAAAGFCAMAAYYAVFRLPFALAPTAVFGLTALTALAASLFPPTLSGLQFPEALFDLASSPAPAIAMLTFGLLAFAVAMRFDFKDPYRLSRYAACAFWLHVVAAPALVNTICLTFYNLGGGLGYAAAAAAFVLIACLALLIDRRSFLLAGVVYAALVLGAAFEATGGADSIVFGGTVGLLGAGITLLGAKWTAARAGLLAALPNFPGKDRLPPAVS